MILEQAKEIIHKVRTPLSVIKTFVSNVEPSDEDEIQLHKITLTSIDKLSKAIDELAILVNNNSRYDVT